MSLQPDSVESAPFEHELHGMVPLVRVLERIAAALERAYPPPPPPAPEVGPLTLPGLEPKPKPPKKGAKAKGRTTAPLELAPEVMANLAKWTSETVPSEAGVVAYHVQCCLDFHRARGSLMADWPATCRTWIRNAPVFRKGAPPPDVPKTPEARVKDTRSAAERIRAAEEARAQRQERKQREQSNWKS